MPEDCSRPVKAIWLECLKRAREQRGRDDLEAYAHAVTGFVANLEMAASSSPRFQEALKHQLEILEGLEDISRPTFSLKE